MKLLIFVIIVVAWFIAAALYFLSCPGFLPYMKRSMKRYTTESKRSEYLTQQEIYETLVKAKELYISSESNVIGMCYAISHVIANSGILIGSLYRYIPKFTYEFCRGKSKKPDGYWWDKSDRKSRIKAFDKLIDYYKEE